MQKVFFVLKFEKNDFQHSIEDHCPVFLATSHPHLEPDGTLWNIGTGGDKKSGFFYTIFKFPPKSESK